LNKDESQRARLDGIAPRHIRKKAADWVVDLHSPDRSPEMEARLRRWIAADPRHAAAFELATEAWQRSEVPAALRPQDGGSLQPDFDWTPRRRRARMAAPALAAVAALSAALGLAFYCLKDDALTTGSAEQKTVALTDGSEVTLNANSRVVVQYDDRVRKVTLSRGEALFNVSKHQPRPFVVVMGDRKVVAVGTSFQIRREESGSEFAVTLVEGRVAIEPISWSNVVPKDLVAGLTLLNPGERLRFAANKPDARDAPSLDKVTAWQRGQLIFEDTPLRDAAAEFNRYGGHIIKVADSVSASIHVGGVFRIGDPSSFAQAMANTHQLRVIERGNEILLGN
jgi:transmembrane sensor